MNATFQCSARPFETFWIFSRNEWGPADHMCNCKKQSEQPKSKFLRVAMGWPCASSVSVKGLREQFGTACRWMLTFRCNISMQCAPLWNILNIYKLKEWVGTSWPFVQLQEAIRTTKVFENCSGLALRLKRFLVKFAGTVWYKCNISMQWAPLWNILNNWMNKKILTDNRAWDD